MIESDAAPGMYSRWSQTVKPTHVKLPVLVMCTYAKPGACSSDTCHSMSCECGFRRILIARSDAL